MSSTEVAGSTEIPNIFYHPINVKIANIIYGFCSEQDDTISKLCTIQLFHSYFSFRKRRSQRDVTKTQTSTPSFISDKCITRNPWLLLATSFSLALSYEGRWQVPSIAVWSSLYEFMAEFTIMALKFYNILLTETGIWTPNFLLDSPACWPIYYHMLQ